MPEPLWKDDRPPSRGELEHYLTNVLGLPKEDAERLVTAYSDNGPMGPSGDDWTPESLSEYVDDLVGLWRRDENNLRSAGGPETDAEASMRTAAAEIQVAREQEEDSRRDAEGRQQRDSAAAAVATIRESTYSRARARWVTDMGGPFGHGGHSFPNGLNVEQSLASRVMVDANGNPIIDPETGELVPANSDMIFDALRYAQFDMGSLSFNWPSHRQRTGSTNPRPGGRLPSIREIEGPVEDQARPLYTHRSADAIAAGAPYERGQTSRNRQAPRTRYVTPSQALNLLSTMSEDGLIALQQKMLDAGLYEAAAAALGADSPLPQWGVTDPLTRRAFMELFVHAGQRPGESIDKVLSDLTENNLVRSAQEGGGESGAGGSLEVDIPAFEPKIMSAETLGQTIDDLAQDLLGQFVPEDQKQSLIAKMQERETAVQRQAYDQSVADIRAQAGQQASLATGGAGNDLDAFMAAISARESGGSYTARNRTTEAFGRYQIMPANWGPWAQRAGLPRNAPQTPENQEIVARTIMLDYYQRFGNWRDVAIAWFAGPGAVGRPGAENRSDGNMTVRRYADEVVSRMGGRAMPGGLVETGGAIHAPIEEFDPQAELRAAIKAGDPLGFEAHEFADRAVEWFSLLGGLV